MKTDPKARERQRRYYQRHRKTELARQKKYREAKPKPDCPVPVSVPGWGYLPYWEVPF